MDRKIDVVLKGKSDFSIYSTDDGTPGTIENPHIRIRADISPRGQLWDAMFIDDVKPDEDSALDRLMDAVKDALRQNAGHEVTVVICQYDNSL